LGEAHTEQSDDPDFQKEVGAGDITTDDLE
jgi:hypothetical protein